MNGRKYTIFGCGWPKEFAGQASFCAGQDIFVGPELKKVVYCNSDNGNRAGMVAYVRIFTVITPPVTVTGTMR